MPYASDKQRKAMHAAAEGRGTIGIPKNVAKKFVKDADKAPQPTTRKRG